jgi:hypothetical protein
MRSFSRSLAVVLMSAGAVVVAAGDALAERIRCSSRDYRYAFCSTRQQVVSARLVKRHSRRPCEASYTWGWQRDGIWVDDGCDADFDVVLRDFGPGPRPPLPGPPIGGPPAGINPSPWTIGDWRGQGYRLSVYRGGSVVLSGAGIRRQERGYINGDEIVLYDGQRLRVARDRNRLRLSWPNGRGVVLSRR